MRTHTIALLTALVLCTLPAQAQIGGPTDAFGRAKRAEFNLGHLGAGAQIRGEEEHATYGLKEDQVCLSVTRVDAGGPGQRAGLRKGDRVIAIEGTQLTLDDDPIHLLGAAMTARLSGTKRGPLLLKIKRQGQEGTLKVAIPSYGKNWEARLRAESFSRLLKIMRGRGGFSGKGGASGVAIASVCGLALLAGGGQGKLKAGLGSVRSFVVSGAGRGQPKVVVPVKGPNGSSVNWSLGYAAVFLAEYLKLTGDGAVRSKLTWICRAIEANQEVNGGWAHGPGGPNSLGYTDLAQVTNLVLAGYGAAGQLGIKISDKTVDRGIAYLEGTSNEMGGVGYSQRKGEKGLSDPGKTAGAIMVFTACGKTAHPFFPKMKSYVATNLEYLVEGHASPLVHWQVGAIGCSMYAEGWKQFREMYTKEILLARKPDGSFVARPSSEIATGKWHDGGMGNVWASASYLLSWALDDSKLRLFKKPKDDPKQPKDSGERTGQ